MHCVASWNNEKSETIGDAIHVFKDSEGYWDFESVTDGNEYWNMKSNSEMIDFQEFNNAQDYVTFREYRDGGYGEINIDYSYCAPVISGNEFDNSQSISQNFLPTYLGGSYMPMYMPYGGMFMPFVSSPLIPIPIFIGGTLIGWRRNNLFFGRRFMPGLGGMNFIRSGLWNSINYGLRTRRYGSPSGLMYVEDNFGRRNNRLPPIGYSLDSRNNKRGGGFSIRGHRRNSLGKKNGINSRNLRKSRTREHNRNRSKNNNNFSRQNNRNFNSNRPNKPFNSKSRMSNRRNNNFNRNNLRQQKHFENRPNISRKSQFGRNRKPGNGKVRQNIFSQRLQNRGFQNSKNKIRNNNFQRKNQVNFKFFNRSNLRQLRNKNTFMNRQFLRNFPSQSRTNKPRNSHRNNFPKPRTSLSRQGNKGRRG
ncbi:Hypothetical protein SRAE_1000344800 [Strongyloides ratti]|uniref:Uncharacterized protein n=1 Tax=Strongyloides ratti TaxID=34506 RepID=A0A090LCJ4_STRRB|nr:Hypothetical protein SRAE_1000344800 [Strongyloides ratti]CEF65195.1 Hypothetical protein SRAE_1000344800 [Strongyloides ratti]